MYFIKKNMVFCIILIEEKWKPVTVNHDFDLICGNSLRVEHLFFNDFYLKLNSIQVLCKTFYQRI